MCYNPLETEIYKSRKQSFKKKNNFGIRKCCRCGDLSHKVGECTFK